VYTFRETFTRGPLSQTPRASFSALKWLPLFFATQVGVPGGFVRRNADTSMFKQGGFSAHRRGLLLKDA
jgi:hypothetical protein